jgi:hypothetical protein
VDEAFDVYGLEKPTIVLFLRRNTSRLDCLWQLCSQRETGKLKSTVGDWAAAPTRQNSSQYPLWRHYASKNDETNSFWIE